MRYLSRVTLACISALSLAWPAIAAESAIPDFSGVIWGRNWLYLEQPPSGLGPVLGRPRTGDAQPLVGDYANPMLKPEAAALLKTRGEISLGGGVIPDPVNQCMPEPTPFMLAVQGGIQILQHKDEVTLIYIGDHQVRHVRMNAPHPAHVTPSWYGDSVGHYEGDTLVIDTVGQRVGLLAVVDLFGTPFSPALHVVERYRLIDGEAARAAVAKHESKYFPPGRSNYRIGPYGRGLIDPDISKKGLQVEVTVEDPAMFNTPWSGFITYLPATGTWPEVVCATARRADSKEVEIPRADTPDF